MYGDDMKKLTVMCTIFVLFLFGALLYIGYSIKNQNRPYTAFEHDLAEIAEVYISTNKVNVNIGNNTNISIEKMMEDNYLVSNVVNEDTCEGYVTISRGPSGYNYKPYIKCSKYETK